MFVRNDAKTFRFCRSKCHKNFKYAFLSLHSHFHHLQRKKITPPSSCLSTLSPSLEGLFVMNIECSYVRSLLLRRMKRNPRKLKWTKAFRKAAGKEMTIVRLRTHSYHPFSNGSGRCDRVWKRIAFPLFRAMHGNKSA